MFLMILLIMVMGVGMVLFIYFLTRTPSSTSNFEEFKLAHSLGSNEINKQVAKICAKKSATPDSVLKFLLDQGAVHRATDIHLEYIANKYQARFRIDGILMDIAVIPPSMSARLVVHVKNRANLVAYRKDIPQEGRFTHTIEGEKAMGIRLSIMPTHGKESIVMRQFDALRANMDVMGLGFSPAVRDNYLELLEKPQGLILITGPTNSGKTSTIYASIQHLTNQSRRGEKIVSLEDPIEFPLDCISQIEVNEKRDLTFDKLLSNVLRQDVEIIVVGEIRDRATAEIALRSSLTGHLILSTLHCGSAAEAPRRLVNLGMPSSLVGESLLGVIGQRLVRRVCSHCRAGDPITLEKRAFMKVPDQIKTTYKGRGCHHCMHTGYYGRMAIAEFLKIDKQAIALINDGVSTARIHEQAIGRGMVDIKSDAFDKLGQGLTSLDEITRVLR